MGLFGGKGRTFSPRSPPQKKFAADTSGAFASPNTAPSWLELPCEGLGSVSCRMAKDTGKGWCGLWKGVWAPPCHPVLPYEIPADHTEQHIQHMLRPPPPPLKLRLCLLHPAPVPLSRAGRTAAWSATPLRHFISWYLFIYFL